MLMLINCILLCPPWGGSQAFGAPANRVDAQIDANVGSSIGSFASFSPSRRATLARFIPWKNRSKIMLGETIENIVEECDLGPAVSPDRAIAIAMDDLAFCSSATRPPLRC